MLTVKYSGLVHPVTSTFCTLNRPAGCFKESGDALFWHCYRKVEKHPNYYEGMPEEDEQMLLLRVLMSLGRRRNKCPNAARGEASLFS